MNSPLFSVVVPVYRSQNTLVTLYERIDKSFKHIGHEYELILVDDGGGDDSWQVMKTLRERSKRVKIIQLTRNFGQHNAIMSGLRFAGGDYVITMDDDLQHPPEEIPTLIEEIIGGDFDVVCGLPRKRRHSAIRNAGSCILSKLVSFSQYSDFEVASLRIIRRQVVENIIHVQTPNPVVDMLILMITHNIGFVEVDHHKRPDGRSNYSAAKLTRLFFDCILYNSVLPLKLVFFVGLVCFCSSAVLGIYYLFSYLVGDITVPGWTTLVLLILSSSGIIMCSIGIIGEYLLRIIQTLSGRPQYIIRQKETESN